MQLLDFAGGDDTLISAFESQGAHALPLGDGRDEGHVYRIRIDPGGAVGPHEAGFGQLCLVVTGSGWISGWDGARYSIATGRGAWIARGEVHARGTDTGLTAIMIQLTDLTAATIARRAVQAASAADRPGQRAGVRPNRPAFRAGGQLPERAGKRMFVRAPA